MEEISCFEEEILLEISLIVPLCSYNDVWVLDTKTDTWTQPHPGITEEMDDGTIRFVSPFSCILGGSTLCYQCNVPFSRFCQPWNDCPEPRGGHSSCVVENSLIVFGGYGGIATPCLPLLEQD